MNRKVGVLVGAAVILALAGGLYAWNRNRKPPIDPNLKVMVDGKEVDPATLKDVKGPDGKPLDLSRRIDPVGPMGEMVNAYFALPKGPQRTAYLDKMIDQQEAMRKNMQTAPDGRVRINMTGGPTTGPSTQPAQSVMIQRTGGPGGGNPLDALPPELNAKMAEMMADLKKRRAERGLPPGPVGMMIMRTNDKTTVTPGAPVLRLSHRRHRVPKLLQRLVLDLADAFTRQTDSLADFFERHRFFTGQAVSQLQDRGLALINILEKLGQLGQFGLVVHFVVRRGIVDVGHDVVDRHLAVGAGELAGRIERLHRLLDDPQLLLADFHELRQLVVGRRATEVVFQLPRRPLQGGHELDHVRRHVDRLRRVDQGPFDRLLDPPAGVGAEPAAVLGVEAFDRLQEADIAFFDQVQQRQASVHVVLGDVHHQPQVRLHHVLACGEVVVLDDAAGEGLFLIARKQWRFVDLPQVQLEARLNGGAGHGVLPSVRTVGRG
jgi:hypothetical protein